MITTRRAAPRGRWMSGSAKARTKSSLRAVTLLFALAPALGCQLLGQDPARCDQSVATVRQAVGFGDFASARKWRDYTWKVCDERAVVATLDKEIVDGEAAVAAAAKAAEEKVKQVAQARINAAQALWLKFDAAPAAERTKAGLEQTHKSAKRLEKGLPPAFLTKLRSYNDAEYQKRLAAIGR